MDLKGMRTYLMAGGIIIHQFVIMFGYDIPDDMVSESIDLILAGLAMYFRWKAVIKPAVVISAPVVMP